MPSRIINSADEFTNAIHDGVRLMGAYNATLRTIKRFVNQASLLTMHLYNDPESGINEKDLVTMTGLHEFDHELLDLIGKGEVEAVAGKIKPIFPDIDQIL